LFFITIFFIPRKFFVLNESLFVGCHKFFIPFSSKKIKKPLSFFNISLSVEVPVIAVFLICSNHNHV
jgi:hypothetical protein